MYAYHFALGSCEYLGDSIAAPDPLDVGKYLLPAHATFTAPPTCADAEAVVWQGDAWAVVPDYRNTVGYVDGQQHTITDIGPLPDGWTDQAPPSPLHTWQDGAWVLDAVRAWAAVRADRDQRIAACDWTQLPDCPLADAQRQAWVIYRQALRDITNQTDPINVVWPDMDAAEGVEIPDKATE